LLPVVGFGKSVGRVTGFTQFFGWEKGIEPPLPPVYSRFLGYGASIANYECGLHLAKI
jgi:hypothetical protein